MIFEALENRQLLSGTWTALAHNAPASLGTMMLLTDGSVMVQADGVSKNWYKLTPDSTGSYVNGTWTTLAPMSLERLYFASEVLKDGRVLVLGGEYSGSSGAQNTTNTGEIYDPVANTWTSIPNFPQSSFGDDPTELLPDGRVMAGYIFGPQTYIYDPVSNTWTTGATKLNNDRSDEETWVKLSDDSILSYNVFGNAQHAQRYVPSLNQWVDAGSVPVQLQTSGGSELGPALRMTDGRVFFIGGTKHNAIYTPPTTPTGTGSWVAAPDTPSNLGANDAPAAMMVNGKILYAAGDTSTSFKPPTSLFEYDPTSNTISTATTTGEPNLSSTSPFITRMLVLPSGQVLFNPDSNKLYVYTPTGSANASWAPTVTNIVNDGSGTFTMTGTQLNGLSEGASYGDDAEMSSNYPIIRMKDAAGGVHFARSFNFSSVGVGQTQPTTADFTLPSGSNPGAYLVSAIANGIASSDVLNVEVTSSATVTLQTDPNNSSNLQVLSGSTVLGSFPYSAFSDVIVSGDNSGDTIVVQGNYAGHNVTIGAGGGADNITISNFGPNMTVNGASSNDNITLDFSGGVPVTNIGLSGGNLKVIGTNSADTATAHSNVLNFGSATIATGGLNSMEIDSDGGNDTLTIADALPYQPVFNGGTGTDTLNVNAGSMVFNSDLQLGTALLLMNVASGAAVTFNSTEHLGALNLSGGSATMTASGSHVLVVKQFTASGSGRLDLGNNPMIDDYTGTSPIAAISAALASGYAASSWNGPGISSSTAAADTNHWTALGYAEASLLAISSFAGQSVDSSAIVIKYTYYGDNDLDGKVDLNDFSVLLDGMHGLGSGWVYGDYDYSGAIDSTDFSTFVNAYNRHGPTL